MTSEFKLVQVECNRCGAPLEISESSRFVTCSHCNSRLAVHNTGSARFTEELQGMAEDLGVIRMQNELEQLDREWLMRKEELMISGQHGVKTEPSRVGGILILLVGGAFTIFWITMAMKSGAPGFFPAFGFVMLIMLGFAGVNSFFKAGRYEKAQDTYQQRRAQLAASLERRREAAR